MANQSYYLVDFASVTTGRIVCRRRASLTGGGWRGVEFVTSLIIPMMKLIIPTVNAIIRGNIIANGWPQGEPNIIE